MNISVLLFFIFCLNLSVWRLQIGHIAVIRIGSTKATQAELHFKHINIIIANPNNTFCPHLKCKFSYDLFMADYDTKLSSLFLPQNTTVLWLYTKRTRPENTRGVRLPHLYCGCQSSCTIKLHVILYYEMQWQETVDISIMIQMNIAYFEHCDPEVCRKCLWFEYKILLRVQ